MKPLRLAIGAAVTVGALAALAVPAAAQNPVKIPVPVYADTVSSSRGDVRLSRVCTQTNMFPRKARVVFRAWAMDSARARRSPRSRSGTRTSRSRASRTSRSRTARMVPAASKVRFWSAAWAIPVDYPLGVVPFRIVFKTEDGQFGIFQQPAIDGQQLTVTP